MFPCGLMLPIRALGGNSDASAHSVSVNHEDDVAMGRLMTPTTTYDRTGVSVGTTAAQAGNMPNAPVGRASAVVTARGRCKWNVVTFRFIAVSAVLLPPEADREQDDARQGDEAEDEQEGIRHDVVTCTSRTMVRGCDIWPNGYHD